MNINIRKDFFTSVDGYDKHCKICDTACKSEGYNIISNEAITMNGVPETRNYWQVHYGFVCSEKCGTILILQNI